MCIHLTHAQDDLSTVATEGQKQLNAVLLTVKSIVAILCGIASYIGLGKANSKSHIKGEDAVSSYTNFFISIMLAGITWTLLGVIFK